MGQNFGLVVFGFSLLMNDVRMLTNTYWSRQVLLLIDAQQTTIIQGPGSLCIIVAIAPN